MDSVLGLVRHAGNDSLLRAIEMSLLSTLHGQPLHIHAEGLRGTGKTTAMRAVRRALPRIRRIKDCLYNCDPAAPHCPQHRALPGEEVAALGEEWVPMPFLEISHSAKVGTVVGSINLGLLVSQTQPEAALLPGTIPQAHRGIIFVDEINRLAETSPELADVLLDVMGTKPGRVQIEETGLPAVELPVQVSVWAASNPDEDPGPLEEVRRQLSDRFDFAVYTDRPSNTAVVEEILTAADSGSVARTPSFAGGVKVEQFRAELAGRVMKLRAVLVPVELRQQIADLYSRYSLESLRAVQAVQAGIRLAACLEGRGEAGPDDLARVVPLALRHRVDQETMKKVAAQLAGLNQRVESPPAPAQAVAARPRFPGLSFGASAVQPLPENESAGVPGAEGRAEPAVSGQAEREEVPGGGSGAGGTPQQQAGAQPCNRLDDGWLQRALTSLRRSMGMPGAGTAGGAGGTGAGNNLGARPGSGGARPEGPQGEAGARQGAGRMPGSLPGGYGGESRRAADQPESGSGVETDPLKFPPAAPPQKARPIALLRAEEFIKTEEELGR